MASDSVQAPTQLTWVSGLEKQRKKRFSSKVKTGCETCKKRRIKCDEGRPTCANCNRGGRRCEGYQSAAPDVYWFEHDGKGAKHSSITSVSRSVDLKYGTDGDKAILDLFLNKTAVEIVKFSNPYFWYTLVPQVSWSHEGIRQAVAAVGLACNEYERYERSEKPVASRRTQSFHHYNAAIRSLTTTTGKTTPPDIMLICCVLFWVFENLKNRPCIAMTHLKAAINMLNERARPPSHREDLVSTYIEPILQEGMRSAATILPTGGRKRHDAPPTLIDMAKYQPSESPKDIHVCRYDFGQCSEALVITRRMQMSASSPNPDVGMLRKLFMDWRAALDRNAHRFPEECVRMLRMHYASNMLTVDILESHVNGTKVRESPEWRPRLRWVLDEAQYFAHLRQKQTKDGTYQPIIHLPMIKLLTAVARQGTARDNDYAEEAIQLLEDHEWFEGIWNSRVAAELTKLMRSLDSDHIYCRTGDLEALFERAAGIKEHVPTKRKKSPDPSAAFEFNATVQETVP